jgi:phosphoketolase
MAGFVKRLWAGDLPLRQAIWEYAVFYGLLINVLTDVLFYALLINDANAALVVLAFVLPIPYNILVIVAVWRSAEHYQGPERSRDLARLGIVIWMVFLTLA